MRRFAQIGFLLVSTGLASSVWAVDPIERSGDILQFAIPLAAYGSTFYFDDADGRSEFYKSFIANVWVTEHLKLLVNKQRPNGSEQSFPSGHTASAFQGAHFIHQRYGLSYAVPAYLLASFVGYSRVESKNHYWEDVLAGAAIGVASAMAFTTPYSKQTIQPFVQKDFYGVAITSRW